VLLLVLLDKEENQSQKVRQNGLAKHTSPQSTRLPSPHPRVLYYCMLQHSERHSLEALATTTITHALLFTSLKYTARRVRSEARLDTMLLFKPGLTGMKFLDLVGGKYLIDLGYLEVTNYCCQQNKQVLYLLAAALA